MYILWKEVGIGAEVGGGVLNDVKRKTCFWLSAAMAMGHIHKIHYTPLKQKYKHKFVTAFGTYIPVKKPTSRMKLTLYIPDNS